MTTSAWIRAAEALSGLAALLTGCATSFSASPSVVDIKNVVLSNFTGDCADYSANYPAAVTDVKRDTKWAISGSLSLLTALTGLTVWLTQRRRNRKTSSHAPATNKKAVS